MIYELWHLKSGNLLEEFSSESEALDAIRGYVDANDPGLINELSLSAVPSRREEEGAALPPTLSGEALRARLNGGRVDGRPVTKRSRPRPTSVDERLAK